MDIAAHGPAVVRSNAYRSREAGFTILEAMVVVSIIAISAALAAPALSEAMAVRRAGEANHSVVRIAANARSQAIAYGRAHLLLFNSAPPGRFELWRGRTNLCTANDWATLVTPDCGANPDCVDGLDMRSYDQGTHTVVVTQPTAALSICFQPDGEVRFLGGGPPAPNAPWATSPPTGAAADEGLVFALDRRENGGSAGVIRRVVIPFGGSPRILR